MIPAQNIDPFCDQKRLTRASLCDIPLAIRLTFTLSLHPGERGLLVLVPYVSSSGDVARDRDPLLRLAAFAPA